MVSKLIMKKKILISVAAVLIVLAAISTFVNLSGNISGKTVAPVAVNIYTVLTILVLIGVSVFMVLRK